MRHDVLVEQVGQRGQGHGRAGVAVADLLHGVGSEQSGRVDRAHVEVAPPGLPRHGQCRAGSRCASRPFAFAVRVVVDLVGFFAFGAVLDAAVGTERFSFNRG